MLKCKSHVVAYEIRRLSDSRFLYVLKTGEVVFTHSVSTTFPSFQSALDCVRGLGLKGCSIERVS